MAQHIVYYGMHFMHLRKTHILLFWGTVFLIVYQFFSNLLFHSDFRCSYLTHYLKWNIKISISIYIFISVSLLSFASFCFILRVCIISFIYIFKWCIFLKDWPFYQYKMSLSVSRNNYCLKVLFKYIFLQPFELFGYCLYGMSLFNILLSTYLVF